MKDIQGQCETDDFDTEDADASLQTSELDDTLKESDSQKESSAYDYDTKEITESDTATDQQFTENSSPNTHEFEIIDDIGLDDEGGDSNPEDLSDEDLDDSEIYAWLEEGIDRKVLNGDGSNDDGPIEREKVVLKEKGHDPFEVLPEGWVVVTHNSGMPVYLHKQSRVCTLSKPYFLGPGKILKEKEGVSKEASKDEGNETNKTDVMNGMTLDRRERIQLMHHQLKLNVLNRGRKRTHLFRTITVKKFKTWKDRRHHLNTQKRRSRPALPSNTKLITCSIPQEKGDDKAKRKEFVLNPTGKSYVCILHEYAQHTLRVQPRYVFRELENAQNPYSATVVINDVEYGTGYASSKKTAKMEAAKATLSILIPAMNQFIDDGKDNAEDYSFFDEIKIEDPRVSDLCNKAGQPSPYQILLECLKRNYGMGDTQCQIDVKTLKHQKSEYSLTVGKHTVTVVCKNKREGKQRAAQAMLQELHPHITGLGSLLRLYGRSSWKCIKEKKKEEHSITELQSQAGSNKPNTAVLDKLKEEMEKIQIQKVCKDLESHTLTLWFTAKGRIRVIIDYVWKH
ncbi:hypothetical protein KUTeg_010230 [Tegillarca granosa]|uniref:DRBM domain-containing protein n=1 Tax=Tegillarca granosa TaxID=220873 RepID=A0ABQ9F930_TEGGR|nr:hypothetical protein KUTeg_010230 [Tegillarca granosa]